MSIFHAVAYGLILDRSKSMPSVIGLPQFPQGLRWAHLSTRGTTIKVRERQDDSLVETPFIGNLTDYETLSAGNAIQLLIERHPDAASRYGVDLSSVRSHRDQDWWVAFLAALDDAVPTSEQLYEEAPESANRSANFTVPITALRYFYEQLETRKVVAFNESARRLLLRSLPTLWRDSVRHFESYDNDESFNKPRNPLLESHLDEFRRTNDVVASIAGQGGIDSEWSYVEREFSPRRTTGAKHENGTSARNTGGGGIDVLLRNSGGEPGIGEIKLRGDTCAAFALIQSLTYAAELATANQLKRLRRHCPGFNDLTRDPEAVHALVLLLDPDNDPTLGDTLGAIRALNDAGLDGLRLRSVSIWGPASKGWVRIDR
jgi:hypothetical protein